MSVKYVIEQLYNDTFIVRERVFLFFWTTLEKQTLNGGVPVYFDRLSEAQAFLDHYIKTKQKRPRVKKSYLFDEDGTPHTESTKPEDLYF